MAKYWDTEVEAVDAMNQDKIIHSSVRVPHDVPDSQLTELIQAVGEASAAALREWQEARRAAL